MANSRRRGTPSEHRQPASAWSGPSAASLVDDACRSIVQGKQASRELNRWVGTVDVSETEFRLLWQLERAGDSEPLEVAALDQVALAERLAVSPAQVSGLVERLAASEYIASHPLPADRRRQLWRITLAGKLLLSTVLQQVQTHVSAPTIAKEVA
jgi:DNA-binding MarR family transcriptional regulator